MATYDISSVAAAGNYTRELRPITYSRVIDFAKVTTSGGTGVAGDIVQFIPVGDGFMVTDVLVKVITASSTGSSTFAVGDTSDDDGYMTATTGVATSSANTILQADGAYFVATGNRTKFAKWYTAADKIAVKLGATAPLNGKIQVVVIGQFVDNI